ncbi:MAG: ribonuclease P protein component [Candidatus Pacebacteria bacterium]|nr:ribonuclease P protein component [Candidatus Paceibacterota bacterium]MDR3583254.1 ribonuclease P protein component [Candidatus Paceibacterota bacterium]
MLPPKNRLIKKKDFETVHRLGRFFSFGLLAAKVSRNTREETRLGFAVGIKFSKKAVQRNRIKRQLREIVRLNLEKIKPGFDVVVVVRKTQDELGYAELESLILGLLQKTGVLKR